MKTFSKDQLIEDLDFMLKTFKEVHPNLYAEISRKVVVQKIAMIHNSLHDGMTTMKFFQIIGKLVPLFKDGHTYLQPWQLINTPDFKYFPPSVCVEGSKAKIVYDITDNFEINDELISINGIPLIKIIPEMLEYISAETILFKTAELKRSFYVLLSVLFDVNSPFMIEVRRDDKAFLKTIEGLTSAQFKELSSKKKIEPNSLKETFDIENGIGIFRIKTFGYHNENITCKKT